MVEAKQSQSCGGSLPAATDGETEGWTHLKCSCGLDYLAFLVSRIRVGVRVFVFLYMRDI